MAGEAVARYRRRVTIHYVNPDAITASPVAPDGSAQWWRSVLGIGSGMKLPADRPGNRA